MSIEVVYEDTRAEFAARPPYGKPVTFVVVDREVDIRVGRSWGRGNMQKRFVVCLKGSTGAGFSHHVSFELACSRALTRARRYHDAYSVPRGLAMAS